MQAASRQLHTRHIAYITIVILTAVIGAAGLYVWSNSVGSLAARVKSVCDVSTDGGRVVLWNKSLESAKDNPLLGVGAGNWRIIIPSYGLDQLPEEVFVSKNCQRPHNDYVWVLSETGVPGLVFYVAAFGITLFYILRVIGQGQEIGDKVLAICMFFGIVGYMGIAFFDFPKERIFHTVALLLMMAVVLTMYQRVHVPSRRPYPRLAVVGGLLSVILLLTAVANGYTRLQAEIHTKRALQAREAKDWNTVISEIDKGYSVFATLDPTSMPLKWYRGEANFLLKRNRDALNDYRQAYSAHPYNVHVLNNLASCYELAGDHAEAIRLYREALKIYPQFGRAIANLGAAYYNNRDYKQAYEVLSQCDPDIRGPRIKQYLSVVTEALKNKE